MKIQEIVNELRVVRYEYVIAAYIRGRYEIEVYGNVLDAIDAVTRHEENFVCMDEVRLELQAEWRGVSASSYQKLSKYEVRHMGVIESEVRAQIKQRIAIHLARKESAENKHFLAVGTLLAHKSQKASRNACL